MYVLRLLVLLLVTTACYAEAIVVTKATPTFTILLKANPTTGFTWIVKEYDSKLLQPIGKAYLPPKTQVIGRGGQQKMVFTVRPEAFNAPHITFITLIYARPWNLQGGILNKIKVLIKHDNEPQ